MSITPLLGLGDRVLGLFIPTATARAEEPICSFQYRCSRFCSGGGTQRRKVCRYPSEGSVYYYPWTNRHCGC
ncbi:hypothetical protein [Nocardiopsis sp. CC223A]|uniref:hypothetical protein n=1 Tax=Nocardiopsis sp. CC223A TaxID=3044051 RepID=UPI00278C1107|nr:hypothetical protein [Nocardiopsis sp. CC223A]